MVNKLVSMLVFGIGMFAMILGGQHVFKALDSRSWPETKGVVVSSEVKESRAGRRGRLSYYPLVNYAYEVDGEKYLSTRIHYGDYASPKKDDIENISRRYAKGQTVSVHYNPTNNTESVLDREVGMGAYVGLLIGAVFTMVSIALIVSPKKAAISEQH